MWMEDANYIYRTVRDSVNFIKLHSTSFKHDQIYRAFKRVIPRKTTIIRHTSISRPVQESLHTMPLEATIMIIDNSEYMRNGDYQPTRFHAQSDAVTKVFQTKTDSNPENTVGLMTMANKGCVDSHSVYKNYRTIQTDRNTVQRSS